MEVAGRLAWGHCPARPRKSPLCIRDATICAMQIPYELILGWRYTRAGRATRRNGFISFISGVSMLGIALGVAALIIVLSVMNGFQKEVRDRMLGVISHIEVFAPNGAALPDPQKTLAEIKANPQVVGAAPFIAAQALLARGEDMKGTLVRGIDPALEGQVTDLAVQLRDTAFPKLVSGGFGVVLGGELARSMGVREGDTVTLIAPSGQVTPAGVYMRNWLNQLGPLIPATLNTTRRWPCCTRTMPPGSSALKGLPAFASSSRICTRRAKWRWSCPEA